MGTLSVIRYVQGYFISDKICTGLLYITYNTQGCNFDRVLSANDGRRSR